VSGAGLSGANPFDALGLPARPDLDDEVVRAAWRDIAAATHPDRADGGDPARYARASAAYAELRTPWGRSEAYADMESEDTLTEPPVVSAGIAARVWHGRPVRLLLRALVVALLSLAVLALIPGQPAEPAVITGLVTWFLLTGRADLAPPPVRERR
jgi:hypothetical protein